MTSPRTRIGMIAAVLVAAGILAAAGGTWYLFLRPAAPPPVPLASLPAGSATDAGPATAAATAAAGAPGTPSGVDPSAAPAASLASAVALAGTWTVDGSIGSFSDFSGTFVGYRVREQLANVGAAEAVGRTPDVAGSLTIEGTTLTAAEITADLTTLQSDERMRDGQLRRQALETDRYPKATFTLTQPADLGSVPADGSTADIILTGDLTLHGVTKSVQVSMQARLRGGVISVAGSLTIAFSDYGIQQPQSMLVLSVEDHGTMEFQVHFTRA